MMKCVKYFTVLSAALFVGCAANQPNAGESDFAKWDVIDGYEASLPALASWADYGSASRVAMAIAYERSKLEGTSPEVCQALSQSREFQRMASAGASREDLRVLAGMRDYSGSMTRERARCDHAQEVAARGSAGGF
jgi:hypothetical protein